MTAEVWTVSPDCAWVELPEDDAAVMPFSTHQPMTLSPTGALVWSVLLEGRSSDESMLAPPLTPLSTQQVVDAVAEQVGEDPGVVRRGVITFLEQLEGVGVVSRSTPE